MVIKVDGLTGMNWSWYKKYCKANEIKASNFKEFIKYMEVRLNDEK